MSASTLHAYEDLEEFELDQDFDIDGFLEDGGFDDIADIINENLAIEVNASVELGLSRIVRR